jgi:hypothetical protein
MLEHIVSKTFSTECLNMMILLLHDQFHYTLIYDGQR